MGFEGFPSVIGWELTLACNIRCRHCASSAGSERADELTTQEALAICDQFPALLVEEVDFTGGEPLLRPDWAILAGRLSELGITTRMLTNGLALEPDVVAQMEDVGIASLGVSLDGLGETHDYVRNHAGLFRRALAGIERAADAGLRVAAITTVNALNIDELPALLATLMSAGVNQWQLQPILCQGRGLEATDLRLTEQMYMQLGEFYHDARTAASDSGFRVLPADSLGYFTALDKPDPPWRGCPAGLLSCGITSDGKIKGCLSLPDHVTEGDLRKDDLWGIWFGRDAFAYTRQFSADDLGPNCQSCPEADQCRGGCSAMSYANTGGFHNDPYCFARIERAAAAARGHTAAPEGPVAPGTGPSDDIGDGVVPAQAGAGEVSQDRRPAR